MTYKVQMDGEVRDMSSAEAASLEEWRHRAAADEKVNVKTEELRLSAFTKLKTLGLTEAEVAALLGA